MEAEPPIGIVIVDDHPLIRKGLRTMLAFEPDFAVLGEATDGPEAVDLVLTAMPDVVLLDLHMPGGSGLDACREITRVSPQSRVLMLTLYDDDESVFSAVRAGARGYLLKDSDEAEIIRAIRSVAAGTAIFSASVAGRVLEYFSMPPRAVGDVFPTLSIREREVLELLAKGKSNTAIGDTLFIAPKTVANHVSNIFAKLQVADRAEAIIRAREAGLR